MYKLTCSLLNSWLYGTDPDADEGAFQGFLDTLEGRKKPKTRAMEQGIAFENMVNCCASGLPQAAGAISEDEASMKAAFQFGQRCRDGQLQVREEKAVHWGGMDLLLVGIADCLKCGIIYDIKRVQRYEYGKYQHSTQHPMYLELFPEAMRFDYLIFDGSYCYREQYRRGDFAPIQQTAEAFLRYLEDASLMETYQEHWRV